MTESGSEIGSGHLEWSVGELADAAGVTVRTLHHYDQVGLLTPAARTGAGHRRYRAEQAERLYEITAMRSLGFDLEEIRRALDGGEDLPAVVRLHLHQVRDRLRETSELNHRLERLLAALDSSGHPSTDEIIQATEATVNVNLTKIYTRHGDRGETSTGSRARVPKDDPRIEAGGDVDELNAQLGVVLTHLREQPFAGWLGEIQNELFDLGADLCPPGGRRGAPDRRRVRRAAGEALRRSQRAAFAARVVRAARGRLGLGGAPRGPHRLSPGRAASGIRR